MLTVKHIRFDGAETLDYAERVIFYPDPSVPDRRHSPCPHWGGTITAVGAISGGIDWRSGVVYVMNENGSTIGKYDLGPGSQPDDALGVAAAA